MRWARAWDRSHMTDRRHPIRRPLRARPAAAAIPVLAAAILTMLPMPGIGTAFAQGAPQGMPVEAAKARLEPFAETITVAGGLEAVQAIGVASEITGRLSAIEVVGTVAAPDPEQALPRVRQGHGER